MDSFRRELAGLTDPAPHATHSPDFRDAAVVLCVVMARLFSDSLDRKTLWDRIGSGIRTAAAKRPEGGDGLVSVALDHVKADDGRAAVNDELSRLVAECDARGVEWNAAWAAYITRHASIIVVRARARWQEVKTNAN